MWPSVARLGLFTSLFTQWCLSEEIIWRKGLSKIIAETKAKKYGLYKKRSRRGQFPLYCVPFQYWYLHYLGDDGKANIKGGGIIWRRPKQHIRYYGVFLLILIIFFSFSRYQLLNKPNTHVQICWRKKYLKPPSHKLHVKTRSLILGSKSCFVYFRNVK